MVLEADRKQLEAKFIYSSRNPVHSADANKILQKRKKSTHIAIVRQGAKGFGN